MLLKWFLGLSAIALVAQPSFASAQDTPVGVVAKKVGAGWVFNDTNGMSLYTYVKDTPGRATCLDECAPLWQPVVAASDATVAGDWSLVDRGDGTKQIAHRGMPLYRYAKDPAPGTTFGDGVGKTWWLAARDIWTPPGIAISRGADGRALTDAKGRRLYFNASDKIVSGASIKLDSGCDKTCLGNWKPVAAPLAAVASGDWSIVAREDGPRQWAFLGKPLYVPVDDGRGADRAWQVARLEPPPPVPGGVRYYPSDGGEVAANAEGFTVYALRARSKVDDTPMLCDADCLRAYWRPVAAAPDAKPVGDWTIEEGFDGVKQWAFKGELLFTHTRDEAPGEIAGSRFFTGEWHTLTPSGRVMEGTEQGGG
jgi:predicted lipoprotein with Yx(FWY)xxD motif